MGQVQLWWVREKIRNIRVVLENNRVRRAIAPIATMIRRQPGLLCATRFTKSIMSESKPEWEIDTEVVASEYRIDFRSTLPPDFSDAIGFIAPEHGPLSKYFEKSLELLGVAGRVIDPKKSDFHESIISGSERILLCRPDHFTNQERQMTWEKIQPFYANPDYHVYPGLLSMRIYEAKRELAYFLKVNQIPHPTTNIFYDFDEALVFARSCSMPQVFKTNTGSSATGVEVIRERKDLYRFIKEIFNRHYLKRSLSDYRDLDYGYILLQEYIDPVKEFRVIKIGNSWFGHEKLPGANNDFMSGSGRNAWTPPTHDLLEFCSEIALRFSFDTMCFDVFQSVDGRYLVNELQSWFGSYDNSQMYINGVPGRFIKRDSGWHFEEGFFNVCRSLPLILSSAIADAMRVNKS